MSEKNPCLSLSCRACCHDMKFTGIKVREFIALLGSATPVILPSAHSLDSFSQSSSRGIGCYANWNKHGRLKNLASVSQEKKINVVINGLCPRYQNGCTIYNHPNRPQACDKLAFNGPKCLSERAEKVSC